MGWDGVPQLQHPFSCRQFTDPAAGGWDWLDPSLGKGWIEQAAMGATCKDPAAASLGPLCAPQQWCQPPFIRDLRPQSPAPQMQERSRVGMSFPDTWVTQHHPRSLAQHMDPQSLQDLSCLLALADREQCHHAGDMSVPTVPRVTLRTPQRGLRHPLLCHAA